MDESRVFVAFMSHGSLLFHSFWTACIDHDITYTRHRNASQPSRNSKRLHPTNHEMTSVVNADKDKM
ncbi:hypothetical protein GE21DRAFT_1117237 [Neurospora crassa]|nr:hypothetical protein GE21DRAFT_1117237 [Neurospora crassa]